MKFKERNEEDDDGALDSLTSEVEMLKQKVAIDEDLIEKLNAEVAKRDQDLQTLESERTKLTIANKRIQDLEYEKETYLKTRAHVELVNKKQIQYADLEKEVAELKEETKRLQSSIMNTLHLESVVEDLKNRQTVMDKLQAEVVQLRSCNESLRIDIEHWNNLVKHYCSINNEVESNKPLVIILQRRLDELLKNEVLLVSEKSQLKIDKKHLNEKCENLESQLEDSQEEIKRLNTLFDTLNGNVRRMKKQLQLVTWERNDLRNLLDSCQKEMTFISTDGSNQVDVLQKAIDGYKQREKQIENDPALFASTGVDKLANSTKYEEVLRKYLHATRDNEKLLVQIESLKDQLEFRALKGDFDPRTTKIVHMKSNPTSEAVNHYEDMLSKAKEEVNKLRERVKVLEEGNTQDITRIVEERVETNCAKEVAELRERINSEQTQNKRLCEVFKERSQEFRDAVYMLLGYKLDALPNGLYRLSNMYADLPEDTLLFQMLKSGEMSLLETEYSKALSHLIDLYLKQQRSIPLFLSSLTVELYTKQTMVETSSA